MESLKKAVAIASRVLSESELEAHGTSKLLKQSITRQTPIESLRDAPALQNLPEESIEHVISKAETVTIPTREVILKEGAPATQAFIIKSGILGINLETPGGGGRTVRCCFPGELVGESCVQGAGATCNATVFAKQACELWRFSGESLLELINDIPELKARLDASRTIHRLDSFFSMNEITNTLDVRVRDRLIGCISAIRNVREGEVVEHRETNPSAVYLVATGSIEKHQPDGPPRLYPPDAFVCLKETLHKLPLEGDVIAGAPSRLVVFDTDALFELAIGAPPEVVAVLERLE
jgi:CRP-like cAMP-binding protein